jgi:two-component system, chemotaxis family, CheB/CheR fusion protein
MTEATKKKRPSRRRRPAAADSAADSAAAPGSGGADSAERENKRLEEGPAESDPLGEKPEPTVVGIGASAGGLNALKKLFDRVPEDSGLAFVVVVHLSPEHESHLAEILQPHVKMPVEQVSATVPLEPNRVYVIPPGRNLSTIDTHLRLSELEERRRARAPIDHFFRTLARTHDGHAIAVVLTGTGSDGTLGLRAIKEKGGLTIVQDPNEAEFDGMPQSAIATGMVDRILRLAEIPDTVIRFARTEPRLPVPKDEEEPLPENGRLVLQKVFALLRTRTGREFNRYKPSTIMRRIARRMQLHQVIELPDYLEMLRHQPEEVRALADDLLITVTNFFRDVDVFERLESEVIPALLADRRPEDDVRVWSVGCATGEEAYSLAILLLEAAARLSDPPRVQVFASDLHERSLEKAREGFYPGDVETDVSGERLRRFFIQEDGGYRIRKEVRELVVFAPHNLLGDPPFSRLDLIACRNVMIYLQREVQTEVLELFHYSLRPEGYLVLGSSETVESSNLFRTTDKKLCIFRKRNVPAPDPRLPVFPLTRSRLALGPARPERSGEPVAYGALHHQLVERHAPPSLLLGPDDKVVHVSEHAGRYLVHPGGEITSSAIKLVREELRLELRTALLAARERREPRRSPPVPVAFDGQPREVVLHVRPSQDPEQDGYVLVLFDEWGEAGDGGAAHGGGEASPEERERASRLESELTTTRQRLQAIIEEYETGQEEMRAANEELQSANEELRSTLEELETSKEELQSMNEELQTVNQENRHKVEELAQLTGDLQNLMEAISIATVFLDRDLRILRFTPQVGEIFSVRSTDRGRPLADLTHHLGYSDLLDDARRVLDRLVPIEREVSDEKGRWYLTRVLPYRSSDDRIEGVVITFVDITRRKQAEEELRQLTATLEERVDERTRQLRERDERVRAMASRLAVAEQEERRRLAEVLHDDLQQQLFAVQVRASNAVQALEAGELERAAAHAREVREWLDEAIARTRQLSVDLNPPVLKDAELREAVRWLVGMMSEAHGLEIELRDPDRVEVATQDVRVLVFQALRELLFNVVKHAGVGQATVELARRDGELCIVVSDGGRGFDAGARGEAGDGFGLANLRERLGLFGGRIAVRTRPGAGTRVELRLPVGRAEDEEAAAE